MELSVCGKSSFLELFLLFIDDWDLEDVVEFDADDDCFFSLKIKF